MTDDNDADMVLFADLQALLADPMPADLADTACALWTLRSLDAELAELAELADDDMLVASVRDRDDLITLTYPTESLTIEIELDRRNRTLLAQVVPPQPTRLVAELAGGQQTATMASDVGVFELRNLPTGPVRLRVSAVTAEVGSSSPVETEWFAV